MRLVTWNCAMALRGKKLDALLGLRPDVAVVQECDLETVELLRDEGLQALWVGLQPKKGLAVISWLDAPMEVDPCHDESLRWFVPVRVGDMSMLAAWAFNHRDGLAANSTALTAVERYREFLKAKQAVFIGDLNSNVIWDTPRRPNFRQALDTLDGLGLRSAYHQATGDTPGEERTGTLYWRWKRESAYHIDYAFLSGALQARLLNVEVGSYDDWGTLSDHVPVAVEIDLPSPGHTGPAVSGH